MSLLALLATLQDPHPQRPAGDHPRLLFRAYPDDAVDQDRLRVEIDPAKGLVVLSSRIDGRVAPIARVEGVKIASGR